MIKRLAIGSAFVAAIGLPAAWSAAQPAQLPRCLHGPSESQNNRTRREDALRFAQAINRAENSGPAIVPGQRRAYRPFDQLANLPPTPAGFKTQLNTDGATYTFSVRDTLDSCHFTIFSDQEMWVYDGTPRSVFEVRPVESSR